MEFKTLVKTIGFPLAACVAKTLPEHFWRSLNLTECIAIAGCKYVSSYQLRMIVLRLRDVEVNFSQLFNFYLSNIKDEDLREAILERIISLPLTLDHCYQICQRLPKTDELGRQAFRRLAQLANN